ncbi:MAG: DUF4350 domain-containing protein [Porphyrobacter sp.]|nr:DUF4350 domain-containing protein [Porphyrobacter sp.]
MKGAGASFSRGGALALIGLGFALFLALIWLIGAGAEFGGNGNNGGAHAAGKGLNGYAGLVRLLEASGYEVNRSRSKSGLKTEGLLVLTPPDDADPKELGEILREREYVGPTLVILPKWSAIRPPPILPREAREKFEPGWVIIGNPHRVSWPQQLPEPYFFTDVKEELNPEETANWSGLGLAGELPTRTITYAAETAFHEPLLTDGAGHWLAVKVLGEEGSDYFEDAHWTIFLTEPDMANNYGLADRDRAAAALALVNEASYDGDITDVTFDLTLNGFGASENLLTLAFRPPFLAATLCLMLALFIIGWRAFRRFGPPAAAAGPAIGFGKERLIANGAGLVLRARRFGLLAVPYGALAARRIAERLGLARHDATSIDAALARRLPGEEPFSRRLARLEAAHKPAEILGAAQALDDLTRKL